VACEISANDLRHTIDKDEHLGSLGALKDAQEPQEQHKGGRDTKVAQRGAPQRKVKVLGEGVRSAGKERNKKDKRNKEKKKKKKKKNCRNESQQASQHYLWVQISCKMQDNDHIRPDEKQAISKQ
jgi:hypothetical protein